MAHVPRLFWAEDLTPGATVQIDGERAHHLLRVLKRRVGDELILVEAPSQEWLVRITETQRNHLLAEVLEPRSVQRESPLHSILVQGISRGDRMDFTIQKSVELGVTSIQPVLTERSGVQLDERRQDRKQEHWQAVAQSAAEQSGRTAIPSVRPCLPLAKYLSTPHIGFVLAPGEQNGAAQQSPSGPIELLVGPEGGLSDSELEMAHRAGLQSWAIGPRILRTETAALVALSLLQQKFGDF